MPDDFTLVIRGVREVKAAIDEMDRRVEKATIAALKATQGIAKRAIKAQIKGRPRWDHRGKSSRTGERVNLNLNPHIQERSGGPGVLTGALKRGVGGVRRPKKRGEEYHGGVGVGGGVRNLYKARTEGRFPFLKPGLAKAEPKFPPVWAAAWGKAIHKK